MFVELGGSCRRVIAIQVGFDNLSSARRWLLQFVVSSIDTLLFSWFFADSWKGISNLCVKHIPESCCNNGFEFSHAFCMEIVKNPVQHDQKQQLSISECTVLHEQLPRFAAVLWHLKNGDWSILVWGKTVCLFSWGSSSAATKQTVKPQPQEELFSKADCEKQENP